MNFAYPIVHILFYIAMLFAPPDAERVSITGPDHSFELTRTDGTWKFTGKDATGTASVRDRKVELIGNGKTDTLSVVEYVATAMSHDWVKQPKVTLQDQNTLEKTADGFVLRTDDNKPGMKEYRITFHGLDKKPGDLSINVLGAVKQPGIYQLITGAQVPAGIAAAGGLTEKVDRVTCRILRGEGGTPPHVIEVPWEAILNPAVPGPKLEDHDTIYIKMKSVPTDKAPMVVPIKIAADGALTVADQPCPPDQLAARLKKLAGEESVSVVIHADKKTPYRQVTAVLVACTAAGLKNLAFDAEKP